MTRVVFMGSPAFAVPSLRALVSAGQEVAAVVTQPDRPAGRGGRLAQPAVKAAAVALGLPVLQPASVRGAAVADELRALGAEVFVVAAYGKILPAGLLAVPARGCLNVHASLLPRWRGASPIAAAILQGDGETGVTIMEMAAKMDAGPIVSQRAVTLEGSETEGSLAETLAVVGAALLVETLPRWLAGELHAEAQDEALATYCPLIAKEDGHLAADTDAEAAERAVRAYNPWPGAFVGFRGERLGIWRAHAAPAGGEPHAALAVVDGLPALRLGGGLLMLDEVQRPGGRRLGGREFVNGLRGDLAGAVVLR
jgi:methionyl-tRNA formyltransferase